jgi:hypothetical protein
VLIRAAECGIKPKEFWTLTWKEYQICHLAQERNELNQWRRVRSLAHVIAQSVGETKTLTSFWPLPGDEVEKRVPLTDEERKKIFSIYK